MPRCIVALLLGGLATVAGADDIQVDAKDVYYNVRGTTSAEILDDLKRQAVSVDQDYFAEARWHIQWKYDYDQRVRNLCRAKNLHLILIQRTTLPNWTGAGASPELVARWQNFMDALRVHEKGHTSHGTLAAHAIRDAVRTMRARDCAELAAEVNRTGAAIIQKYVDLDAQYDADTQHGITQGASWQRETAPDGARPSPRPRGLPTSRPQQEPPARPQMEPVRPELPVIRPEPEPVPRQ